jgi:hypothetical protein
MIVLGIILGVILLIVAMIGVGGSIQDKNRRARCKNWKVGDKLSLCRGNYKDILERKKKSFAILRGWDLENLYIDCGDDMIYQVDWSVMNFNKSATWRKNYEDAKKFMGCDPGFSGGVGEESESTGKTYSGKPIDLMNEIECEVYLKKALDAEDYDTAELIKKRMEKFR